MQKPTYPFVPIRRSPQQTLAAVNRQGHPLAQLATGFRILNEMLPKDAAEKFIRPPLQHFDLLSGGR